jgi:hypothetical protein
MTGTNQNSGANSSRRQLLAGFAASGLGIGIGTGRAAESAVATALNTDESSVQQLKATGWIQGQGNLEGAYAGTARTTVEYREGMSTGDGSYEVLGTETYEKEQATLLLGPPLTDPAHGTLETAQDESNPYNVRLGVGPGPVESELHEPGDLSIWSAHQVLWSPDPFDPPTLFQHWMFEFGAGQPDITGRALGTGSDYNYVFTANPRIATDETGYTIFPWSTITGTVDGSAISLRIESTFFDDDGVDDLPTTGPLGEGLSVYRSLTQFVCDVNVSQ